MPRFQIPPGTEIKKNQILDKKISIKVPNTRYWVIGEPLETHLWNVYLLDPNTNRKEILRKKAKTSSFSLFCNIILKTQFPVGKIEIEFDNIKKFILELTLIKKIK